MAVGHGDVLTLTLAPRETSYAEITLAATVDLTMNLLDRLPSGAALSVFFRRGERPTFAQYSLSRVLPSDVGIMEFLRVESGTWFLAFHNGGEVDVTSVRVGFSVSGNIWAVAINLTCAYFNHIDHPEKIPNLQNKVYVSNQLNII